jgi:GH24 family phage-related lysozyme (muramidase)
VTYASVRAAAQEAAKKGTLTPHQLAALTALDESLTDDQKRGFTELWRATGSPADAPPPAWLTPALAIIKRWEGCKLTAYQDVAGVWTVGWGTTVIAGKPVQAGQTITQAEADALLEQGVRGKGAQVLGLLPMAAEWKPNQVAALVSWAYNVGAGALEDSTLRKRLLAGEDPATVVAEELPRWNKSGGKVVEGLVRRRADEVKLFGAPQLELPAQQQAGSVLLKVPYEIQHDNATGTGYRECFSSSAAMVARFWGKVANDDAYNKIRSRYGDTTDVGAQLEALRSMGLDARFRTDGTPVMLETELRAGHPVMVGWLHKGPISSPSGGGHWSVVIGYDTDSWIHNDPNGEADMVRGGYLTQQGGAGVHYSRRNWNRRWLPDGKGWMVLVKPM